MKLLLLAAVIAFSFLFIHGYALACTTTSTLTDYQKEMLNTVRMLSGVLITLSTGTIVLSFSLLKERLSQKIRKWPLFTSWILLFISACFGLLFYGALAYDLGGYRFDPTSPTLRIFLGMQWIIFICGIGFFAAFAIKNFLSK